MTFPEVSYERLPAHMRDSARNYVEHGTPPGGFLTAVLSNDMRGAFVRADAENRAAMGDWAAWLHNDAPIGCWGSQAKVAAWCEAAWQREEAGRV